MYHYDERAGKYISSLQLEAFASEKKKQKKLMCNLEYSLIRLNHLLLRKFWVSVLRWACIKTVLYADVFQHAAPVYGCGQEGGDFERAVYVKGTRLTFAGWYYEEIGNLTTAGKYFLKLPSNWNVLYKVFKGDVQYGRNDRLSFTSAAPVLWEYIEYKCF